MRATKRYIREQLNNPSAAAKLTRRVYDAIMLLEDNPFMGTFAVTGDNAEIVKAKALARLVKELKKGDDCTESYSAEQARAMLGIAE